MTKDSFEIAGKIVTVRTRPLNGDVGHIINVEILTDTYRPSHFQRLVEWVKGLFRRKQSWEEMKASLDPSVRSILDEEDARILEELRKLNE